MYNLSLTNSEYLQVVVALAQDAQHSAKLSDETTDSLFKEYWLNETRSTLALIEKVKDAPYVN